MTMMPSNKLYESLAYSLGPNPRSLMIISATKQYVKIVLRISAVLAILSIYGYESVARMTVFAMIRNVIMIVKREFVQIL